LQDVLMWHATSDLGCPASEVGGGIQAFTSVVGESKNRINFC